MESLGTTSSESAPKKQKEMTKLEKFRELMIKYNLQAYIVPTEDAHQSEYIADCDKRREFLTGFTGSAGTAIVLLTEASLWTDGRYFLQASKQLNNEWILQRTGEKGVPTMQEYLIQKLTPNTRVGVDPTCISKGLATELESKLKEKSISLVPIYENLVDQIWNNRPERTISEVAHHPFEYSGKSTEDKVIELRKHMKENGVDIIVISALDEIAWLLNLRGSDIEFNPVFFAYCIVSHTNVILYSEEDHFSEISLDYEERQNYEQIFSDLTMYAEKKVKIWLDPKTTSWAIYNRINNSSLIFEKESPIILAKAIKNAAEIKGMKKCHKQDAAALIEFFAWLEEELKANHSYTEYELVEILLNFRNSRKLFQSPSFSSIIGYGPNGAIIHYKPEQHNSIRVGTDNLLLVDSGGQYLNGTTDVTRTVHFGEPTPHQKRCFTRVLQGVIALNKIIFPEGTSGRLLDILARAPLWKEGLDYRHGTGHGVGAYLCVHEGPQGIGYRQPYSTPFEPGMTVSDEPGYYEDGAFGIRIENVLVCTEVKTRHQFGNKKYYSFENITQVPIQLNLVDTSLLTEEEIQWIESYHITCLEAIGPEVSPKGLDYLRRATAPIKKK